LFEFDRMFEHVMRGDDRIRYSRDVLLSLRLDSSYLTSAVSESMVMHAVMEGASGHTTYHIRGVEWLTLVRSTPRRGVKRTNQKTFPTPTRGADKSDTVLHTVAWITVSHWFQ